MATRDKNLKKINDELEKLSDDELEQVAGGTNGEYKELRNIVSNYVSEKYYYADDNAIYLDPDEVEDWLKENLNINANIDNGAWYNPFDSAGNSNVYSRNGQSLTHAQVVGEVKNFIKNN